MLYWMMLPLKRYFEFSGRSRPREFWLFGIFAMLLVFAASLIDVALGFGAIEAARYGWSADASLSSTGPVAPLTMLALAIPQLAVTVRRLHDSDHSAWLLLWALLPFFGWIVLLVFYCLHGTRGPNRYGPDPLDQAAGR